MCKAIKRWSQLDLLNSWNILAIRFEAAASVPQFLHKLAHESLYKWAALCLVACFAQIWKHFLVCCQHRSSQKLSADPDPFCSALERVHRPGVCINYVQLWPKWGSPLIVVMFQPVLPWGIASASPRPKLSFILREVLRDIFVYAPAVVLLTTELAMQKME